MDIDNINDKTIELITNAVIKKMLYKFKQEYHQMSTPMSIEDIMEGYMPFQETEEEFLLAEMARLHTLLALYEGKEEFMKAAIIKRRLQIVQKKLDKLDDSLIKIIKKRTNLVKEVLKLKEKKSEIADKKRINKILKKIKKK